MTQESPFNRKRDLPGHSEIIMLRKLIIMILGNWYYFLIALVIAIVAAYFYNKSIFPTFRVTSSILIEEGDNSRLTGFDNNMLEGFGLSPGAQNLDNQILILTSWSLIRNTLKELPFEIDYFKKGAFNDVSYYPLSPIKILPGPNGILPYKVEFSIQHEEGNIYNLRADPKSEIQLDTSIMFGRLIRLDQGSFTILPHPEMEDIYKSGNKIFFKFYDIESLTYIYRKRLSVESASRDGTIVTLSLQGTNKAKDIVFIDKLAEVFELNNLAKKNHEANRIIQFIDEQLIDVTDSLDVTENQLQEFRSRNRIMDVSAQGQQIIDQALVFESEKARLTLEANYYEYLSEYLSNENNQEIPISPATMGIDDPLLGNLMQELSGLQAEYFSSGVGERNPLQAQLELRIGNTKQSIRETLDGIRRANSMAIDENSRLIRDLNAQAANLPVKERQLLGIERKFNLNNILYTFLLQERAEAQIQKASNRPDNELIDPARADLSPVAPNKMKVILIAIVLGIGLPFISLLLGRVIQNKVSSEDDLKMITDLPVVGHIPHSRLSYYTVVLNEPQSRVAEAFRSLRTRMEFLTNATKCPVIVVSSAMPGDGKTFTAINLASAYSLTGKKVLLIGFDLRRPTLSRGFEMNGEVGLSTYLIGKNRLDKIIFNSGYPNLDIIPSGPIPPNPGELSSSHRIKNLLLSLKKKYDFIVIDSAPVGTVSDSYFTASLADATLLMVRHGQTNKHFLNTTLLEAQSNKISGLGLVINDLKTKGSSTRYAYNYKYEYKQQKKNK